MDMVVYTLANMGVGKKYSFTFIPWFEAKKSFKVLTTFLLFYFK